MEGVKEAIILLKQYGTPVFASAVAGAKFTAWAGIIGGILGAALCFILLYYVLPHFKDVPADEENDKEAESMEVERGVAWIITIVIALLSLSFAIGGVYELVSIDYQAYKMMLLK